MGMPDEDLEWRQRCEVVGACGPRERAGGTPGTSFTAVLTKLLSEDLLDSGTSAWRLGTHLKSLNYKSSLKLTPDYKILAEGNTTIPLVPLVQDGPKPTSSAASTVSSRTTTSILTPSPRIIFCLHVDGAVDARQFDRMLSCMPQSVSKAQFAVCEARVVDSTGLFKSDSALAFLSVAVWFWCAMTPRPAYRYIGLVRSGNILQEVAGETETEAKVLESLERDTASNAKRESRKTAIPATMRPPGRLEDQLYSSSSVAKRERPFIEKSQATRISQHLNTQRKPVLTPLRDSGQRDKIKEVAAWVPPSGYLPVACYEPSVGVHSHALSSRDFHFGMRSSRGAVS